MNKIERKRYSKFVREVRKKANQSQLQFAQTVGISQSNLSKMEAGLLEPSLPVFLAAAKLIGGNCALLSKFDQLVWGQQ